jgi:hypothetical protein
VEHIGLFFFFVGCSVVSIVVWVFNWICWYNQCCCCDFLHNPVNKRLAWWLSFIFLCGILACSISGTVTSNRFGFALEGAWCSLERIYYDSKNGVLKENFPKWTGFSKLREDLKNLNDSIKNLPLPEYQEADKTLPPIDKYKDKDYEDKDDQNELIKSSYNYKFVEANRRLAGLKENINKLQDIEGQFNDFNKNMENFKSQFLDEIYYYGRVFRAWGRILPMIYFCLLIIVTTFAGFAMMFYACLKRQGYLATFMHVLWNIIRFFMFSFFIYGCAFGMLYLFLRDAVAYVMYIFSEENIGPNSENCHLIPKETKDYFYNCANNEINYNFKERLRPFLVDTLEDFFTSYHELKLLKEDGDAFSKFDAECGDSTNNCNSTKLDYFSEVAVRKGGLFGNFECSFLRSDLNMVYRTFFDLNIEARILCALSCCIGFFGAVYVYFYLLVLHHYNNELFFDNGTSLFTGFEGYGTSRKKEQNDPAFKKRKMRSEVELSSRNDDF